MPTHFGTCCSGNANQPRSLKAQLQCLLFQEVSPDFSWLELSIPLPLHDQVTGFEPQSSRQQSLRVLLILSVQPPLGTKQSENGGNSQSTETEAIKNMIRVNERTLTGEPPGRQCLMRLLRTAVITPERGGEEEGVHSRRGRTGIQVQDTEGENSAEKLRQHEQRAIHHLIITRMTTMMTTALRTSVYRGSAMCQLQFYALNI